jgi:hypothetical protein
MAEGEVLALGFCSVMDVVFGWGAWRAPNFVREMFAQTKPFRKGSGE